MEQKNVIKQVLVTISFIFFFNFSLSSQEIKKMNVFIYYQNEVELIPKAVIDTVSSKLINSLSLYTFNQFQLLDKTKREKLIQEEEKSKVLTIYDTNDLFNILLVKKISNNKYVLMNGEYKEFID